jgi:TatD DNase family protein
VLTDAHCHPFDLAGCFPAAEEERRRLGVMCAASSTSLKEFEYCVRLSQQAEEQVMAPLLPCFAVHPQFISNSERVTDNKEQLLANGLAALETLAAQGRLAAVGETGFDLYKAAFRSTEKIQDTLFAAHLETALRCNLPLVIHTRRAMHKIFAHASALKKCKAVIFHSWPGTAAEGDALLKRGINAFFSFGTTVMLNHREAMRCCAIFPAERLLTETDAPFQPPRGRGFSSYADLADILKTIESLRGETGLEPVIENNFRSAFGSRCFRPCSSLVALGIHD